MKAWDNFLRRFKLVRRLEIRVRALEGDEADLRRDVADLEKANARLVAEALEEHLAEMLGGKNARPLRLDSASANANGIHLVEQFAHQIEMESRRAKGLDRAMRSHHHPGVLHRVMKVVVFEHRD